MNMHHTVSMHHSITNTVQMLKNKNIGAYQLHHRLVVFFCLFLNSFLFFLVVNKNKKTQGYQNKTELGSLSYNE